MRTLCQCGFDCSDFIGQHAIPANSQLSCPSCDARLNVTAEFSAPRDEEIPGPVAVSATLDQSPPS
jgi:hypothetical protein